MDKIPSAKQSPRIETDGSIRYYCNDTFELGIKITLKNEDDVPIPLEDGDIVRIDFRTKSGTHIKTFEFTSFDDDTVMLVFDDETSALFKVGYYYYDITHEREYRRTLANNNTLVVE